MDTSQTARSIFLEWCAAIRNSEWDIAKSLLAADVIVNGASTPRQGYIQTLMDANFETAHLYMCIVDDEAAEIAARFIIPGPQEGLGQGDEWTEQNLYSVVDDKICAIRILAGANKAEAPGARKDLDTNNTTGAIFQATELRKFYTEYIDSINALTMRDHFDTQCQDVICHNYHRYNRDEYRGMIESSFREISGLRFTIERLIVSKESQQVAARLGFTGVPTKEFRGIPPTGGSVKFSEHAFYQLEGGRIKQVWSLLDLDAYRTSILL
ncbi:hypothetical protein NLG97_g4884 [Lecanicillium saksenae]|uniref:Uncharacterized protein n=1 Tax=Lecanicillium saksenae TaxID=468837 RepID=A0ACC1QVQ8_9HYPO|nr:hypothetical protein NLG97_g4884 [Lecanicillium saksenae]